MPMKLLHVIDRPVRGWANDPISQSNSASMEVPMDSAEHSPFYYKSAAISPFMYGGQQGYIMPGEFFTKLTDGSTRVTGLPLNGVIDSAGECFCVLDNDQVVGFGIGDETIDNNYQLTHGGHSSVVGLDILNYKDNTDEYVLVSFNDATDGDVARRVKSSTTWTPGFLSGLGTQTNGSALTKIVPHAMILGGDGVIYITNGRYLASHTPGSDAVNYQALDLGPGFIATSLALDGNYLVITGYVGTTYITSYAKSVSRAFYWNYFSPSFNKPYGLNDNYVSAIFNRAGAIRAFTAGVDNTTKIQQPGTGSDFTTLFSSRQIGGPPRHGSVENFQGAIHYAPISTSSLHSIGDDGSFHQRTYVATTDGTATDIGMVRNLSSNSLYLGVKIGASYYIVKMAYDRYATGANFTDGLFTLPAKATIELIKVYFSQFGTGASLTVSLFRDFDTISVGGAADLLNRTITYNATDGNPRMYPIVKTITDVSSCYLNLYFGHAAVTNTAAIVRRVEVWGSVPDKI